MRRPLLSATMAWVVLDVAHLLDHMRGDRDLSTEVQTAGFAGYVTTAVVLVLVLRGHRLAPLGAVLLGASAVIGFAAVHLLPHWSAISDSYSDFDTDALNWVLAILPMAAAAALAVAGARAMRQWQPSSP